MNQGLIFMESFGEKEIFRFAVTVAAMACRLEPRGDPRLDFGAEAVGTAGPTRDVDIRGQSELIAQDVDYIDEDGELWIDAVADTHVDLPLAIVVELQRTIRIDGV